MEQWNLIFSILTNRGVTTDRQPGEGEYLRKLPPSQCAWFRETPSRYEWTGSTIREFPGWQAEQTLLAKQKELEADLQAIDKEVQAKQALPFEFNGRNYYPDTEFIQGIFSALTILPANYTETWKTADKEVDGITNIYVTLDKAGIAGLAAAYLLFRKGLWAEGEEKKKLLKAQYLQEA